MFRTVLIQTVILLIISYVLDLCCCSKNVVRINGSWFWFRFHRRFNLIFFFIVNYRSYCFSFISFKLLSLFEELISSVSTFYKFKTNLSPLEAIIRFKSLALSLELSRITLAIILPAIAIVEIATKLISNLISFAFIMLPS
ncbi:putative hypothetical protein domain protein [Mycoplasmoides gallisepticum CA06_2006.052-5-2P]|uniref:Uncharacterized protein n=1 Tax=Mycoplasmoides gallisepticum WI01_2001.043-13-2P TaxID=1159201 RepID=J3YHS8_MYCGL|nr:putative hypothetical protein domain protein [Mycoplasmoides gallisepticum VA94_7994-1-7P]AFP77105.1 putative hypothetical protein domain protein [Mycoplasmoides gallisepticum NC95_13295-2-2P]AFP77863.1 putative hypothetical protein domain protein [Mycoplasmoides gallisepticum NC96_1596-4-2P]AFP78629.1 putative hypothetical protein domain protein [Mycoplasmoides gallisepticum NY01_2001.047-5-1P]AFP79390.1 putative hypothetical protein domain protein [Mycoplasmoides gallisepticum WI01_2001.04